jgi:hypothetical protein
MAAAAYAKINRPERAYRFAKQDQRSRMLRSSSAGHDKLADFEPLDPVIPCPAPFAKIFHFARRANHLYQLAPSCPAEGRWPSSRTLGRVAVDAAASGA